KENQELLEVHVDERVLTLAAFDTAEITSIFQKKCVGNDGKELTKLFGEQYSLLTQYRDNGRDVSVFYATPPGSHPNPRSLLPARFLRPQKLTSALSAQSDSPPPAPFDTCLNFSPHRPL